MVSLYLGLLFLSVARLTRCGPMDLSTIRYRFTTCGQTGRNGPAYEMCLNSYQNTPILADDGNFFFFDNLHASIEHFQGGQGFTIPTTGRYNITLAGAAGGKGICNVEHGRGLVWRGQVDFVSGETLLILVGQKGRSPCENSEFPGLNEQLCRSPPQTENDIVKCNDTWYLNLQSQVQADIFDIVYNNIGGGGGGGASMIRFINHTSEQPEIEQFPIAIAPGGGGSAAATDYDIIDQIQETFPANLTNKEKYQLFLNAKRELFDPEDEAGLGIRGRIYEGSIYRGGAGGGYLTLRNSADVDGGYLNAAENLAEGGFDCARQLFDLYNEIPDPNIHGGFGGGGGQCGSGGSGGGFSGGRSTGSDPLLPGQGGYYYELGRVTVDDQDERGLTELGYELNEASDGYVEIVLENCGCAEQCIVNETVDTFGCFCHSNGTVLALNGFDCAKDIVAELIPSKETAVYINQLTFTPVLLNESLSAFSISALVSMNNYVTNGQNTSCCLVLFGADSQPVLSTNVLRTNGVLDHLTTISIDEHGAFYHSSYYNYLSKPVTVAGGLLVSEGGCELQSSLLNFTVSSHNVSATPVLINMLRDQSKPQLVSLAQTVLELTVEEPTSTSTTETDSSSTPPMIFGPNAAVIWSLIGISALLILGLQGVLYVGLAKCIYNRCIKNKKRKGFSIEDSDRSLFITSTNSMVPNAFYHEYRDCMPPTAYVQARPPQRIDQHTYSIISFSDLEIDGGLTDDPITSSARHFPTKFGVTAPVYDFTAYNKKRVETRGHCWEYPRSRLVYLRELGEGQFGKVLLMKAQGIAGFGGELPVAVKTLSCRAPNMLEKFIQETNLMKQFCHPNIVSLLGVSSHDVNEDSAPLMILEYMPYGDLHDFLKNNRPRLPQQSYSLITPAHFFSMGRDVAEALCFLASQGYVHRDVAARNCLVGPDLSIKIADFGLSREILLKDYYRVEGSTVLPVKWMAPESLLFGVFSTMSDVWSYGVLLWEVVTFGEFPLEELSTEDVIRMAENKTLSHSRPQNCPEEIYMVMRSCHHHNPKDRIKFEEISRNFSKDNIDDYFEESLQI